MKRIKQIRLRPLYYHIKHRYFTLNNAVIAVAAVIAVSWVWGSVAMMQRNYGLQRRLDSKERELLLTQLEVQTLEFQQQYYQSAEFQELAAREYLGLGLPGERVLILPPNSEEAKRAGQSAQTVSETVVAPSNFEQWLNFLLGRNARS